MGQFTHYLLDHTYWHKDSIHRFIQAVIYQVKKNPLELMINFL